MVSNLTKNKLQKEIYAIVIHYFLSLKHHKTSLKIKTKDLTFYYVALLLF